MNARYALALPLVLLAGFAGIWHLQLNIDAQQAALHQDRDDLLLTSPRLLKVISLEYAPLLADVYWTRAVQYYGEKHASHENNLESLWPLLYISTTLDPQLLPAYRFGAMFLSEAAPRGAGRPDLAVALIQRGIRENPDYWRFYEDLGFIYYFDVKDYAKASAAFAEGARKPGAQVWMKVMAAKIAAEGESLETSAFLWRDIYQNTTDAEMKKNALAHLQLLSAQEDCQRLNTLANEYEKREGRRAMNLNQLVQAGLLQGVPVDPANFIYVMGDDGKVQLNPASPLWEKQKIFEKLK